MPNDKRLGLDSPLDLLAKLDWEISQLGQVVKHEAEASFHAFNCAITAWSICDWVWNSATGDLLERIRLASPKPDVHTSECLASLLRQNSRELAICQQLANGSKHFVLQANNDDRVSSYRSASVSLFESQSGESHALQTFGVFVEDEARTYSAIGLFSRARNYWYEFFERYNVANARQPDRGDNQKSGS